MLMVKKFVQIYNEFGAVGIAQRIRALLKEQVGYFKPANIHRFLLKKSRLYGNCVRFITDIELTHQVQQDILSKGFRSIDQFNFQGYKKSERVFILASGSSVNDLSHSDWEHISASDSIGFNYWLVHDFVPSFYFIEPVGPGGVWEVLLKLFDLRKNAYSEVPVICDYKLWQIYEKWNPLAKIPSEVIGNMYFYAPYYLRLDNRKMVAWVLWCWRLLRLKRAKLNDIINQRASLSALIMFSVIVGYREIVLVGVDLNDTAYFWETSRTKQYPLQPPNDQKGKIHRTVDPEIDINRVSIPIDEYIYLFDRIILKPRGIQLFIGSEKSRLYPRLKKYPFPISSLKT